MLQEQFANIYQMTKKNFFLTDLMKTGHHQNIENFINLNCLKNETFDFTGEYFSLHNYKLEDYTRRIALIDYDNSPYKIYKNDEYWNELEKRVKILKNKNFIFILGHPWESSDNVKEQHQIFLTKLKGIKYHVWSGGVNWFWFLMWQKHRLKKYNFDHSNKKFNFLYLNKEPRAHRVALFNRLTSEGLLNNSLVSFIRLNPPIRLSRAYELPWVDQKNYPQYGYDQDIYEPQFNDTTINIVSETNDNNWDIFITEKVWKPIIAQQVFIVHGNYHYLQMLKKIGFKTFENIIDESYDNERDVGEKIELITKLCKELLKIDSKKLYNDTLEIRQHNYNLFFNKEKLIDSVNKTVLGFLEFADGS